ncbi:MAG: tRNA (adenosine(37)-N6)-threonylcarbamoyltransferase complex ATPase subunit type 1 TsaE [Elusimicrobia bacterium]|nr:tRNA (adenosine(37)-N6)-threonylcarbamoyltransferase complex ATPase subunit type 1 TsaE [Elusimicrobiota bacterium]
MILRTEAETIALGARLGRRLKGGDLVLLRGELGAGKTTLVRGLARGAGYRGRVSSPTFALAHSYKGKRLTLHHLDLYRVKAGETGELGLEELLADPRAAVVVEWPQAAGVWPEDRLDMTLAHDRGGRKVSLWAMGSRGRTLKIAASRPKIGRSARR